MTKVVNTTCGWTVPGGPSGSPGEVVEVSEALAGYLSTRPGFEVVSDNVEKPKQKKSKTRAKRASTGEGE